jgi:arabinose-5-phosphate isomerase
VADLYVNNEKPLVLPDTTIDEVILEISSKRLGTTAVVENGKLIGIITDGDLRRMLQQKSDINKLTAKEIMSINPRQIAEDMLAVDALDLMRKNNITQLVVTENQAYKGIIHLHDILKEGIL